MGMNLSFLIMQPKQFFIMLMPSGSKKVRSILEKWNTLQLLTKMSHPMNVHLKVDIALIAKT